MLCYSFANAFVRANHNSERRFLFPTQLPSCNFIRDLDCDFSIKQQMAVVIVIEENNVNAITETPLCDCEWQF